MVLWRIFVTVKNFNVGVSWTSYISALNSLAGRLAASKLCLFPLNRYHSSLHPSVWTGLYGSQKQYVYVINVICQEPLNNWLPYRVSLITLKLIVRSKEFHVSCSNTRFSLEIMTVSLQSRTELKFRRKCNSSGLSSNPGTVESAWE